MFGPGVELTAEIILGEIWQYHKEWEEDGDWWWGICNPYKGIPVGYDVNVFNDAEGEPFRAVVYQLEKDGEGGFAIATDDVVLVFPVPTEEEYEKEIMMDMNKFRVEKNSPAELKLEALREILDLDMTCIIGPHTIKATMPQDDGAYTTVVAESTRKNVYSVQVYEGRELSKHIRKEMMDIQIKKNGGIVSTTGIEVLTLIEAMNYALIHPGVVMIDASRPIARTIKYNQETLKIEVSDSQLLSNTKATAKTWVVRPHASRTARLMAMHEASYFNGKLVSVDGKKDMLVSIGDHNITGDGSEYMVGVYKIDKEV